MNIYRDYAEELVGLGYSVTPVDGNKAPFYGGWTKATGELTFKNEYDWAWKKAQGLGLMCGEPSGIICLDIDVRSTSTSEEKLKIRAELETMLPPTFSGRAGSKIKTHSRFYKWNGEINTKFINIDVELLSTGNQCVLPPSIHPEGHKYEWVGVPIHECDVDDFPDLPEDIMLYLRRKNKEIGGSEVSKKDLLESVPGRCKSGSYNYLSAVGVAMRLSGHGFREISERLRAEDKQINSDEASLFFCCSKQTKKWKSPDYETNLKTFVDEICKNHKVEPIHEKYPTMKNGFYFKIEPEEGTKQKVKFLPDEHGLGKYFRDEIFLRKTGSATYKNNGRFYVPIGNPTLLHSTILKTCEERLKAKDIPNIQRMCEAYCVTEETFENPTDKLNMKNGILLKDSMTLVPHDKNVFFTYQIPHEFVDSVETPIFDQLLNIVALRDPQKVRFLTEYIGYCLSGCDYSVFNKFIVLDGGGSNGKSTFNAVVRNLVGTDGYSSVALTDIPKNRFAAEGLAGRLINFCDEEGEGAFKNTGMLKKLTGNDPIRAEKKNKDPFDFINRAKFIISYNKMPHMPDASVGMRRRMVLFACNAQLEGRDKDMKIKNVSKKIHGEYGAIINKCLRAFKDVQEWGAFTEVANQSDRYDAMIRKADPVADFLYRNVAVVADMSDDEKEDLGLAADLGPEKFALDGDILWQGFQNFAGKTSLKKHNFATRIGKMLAKKRGVVCSRVNVKSETSQETLLKKRVYFGITMCQNLRD